MSCSFKNINSNTSSSLEFIQYEDHNMDISGYEPDTEEANAIDEDNYPDTQSTIYSMRLWPSMHKSQNTTSSSCISESTYDTTSYKTISDDEDSIDSECSTCSTKEDSSDRSSSNFTSFSSVTSSSSWCSICNGKRIINNNEKI